MKFVQSLLSVLLGVITLVSAQSGDIVEVAAENGFRSLVDAIAAAGLTADAKSGVFTVFAPTDDAFDALPAAVSQLLSTEPTLIEQIVLYHVIDGVTMSNALSDGDQLATVEGSNLTVAIVDGIVTINEDATVISADVPALNGVIHVIDTVLIPKSILEMLPEVDDTVENTEDGIFQVAAATGRFTKLLAIILASGFGDALNSPGPFSKCTRLY
jgi:uncharacterized surface protein with fasciclin (FAS1) repeats